MLKNLTMCKTRIKLQSMQLESAYISWKLLWLSWICIGLVDSDKWELTSRFVDISIFIKLEQNFALNKFFNVLATTNLFKLGFSN